MSSPEFEPTPEKQEQIPVPVTLTLADRLSRIRDTFSMVATIAFNGMDPDHTRFHRRDES